MRDNHENEPRIRVGLVITELEVGGAEQCLVNLATGLDPARFAPFVCSLASRPEPARDTLPRRLEQAGVPVHFLNANSPRHFLSAIGRLTKLLRRERPDVLQTFLFHANVVGSISAARARARWIAGVRVADPSRWRLSLERWCCRRAESIVCVSRGVASYLAEQGRFPPGRLRVIPNGARVERFESATPVDWTTLGLRPERRVLLFVGRLHQQKGLDWLVTELPAVFEALPEHDLVMVGEGPLRESLRARAGRLGIADRVHLVGWSGAVPQMLAASDLLVLPSRWEGMPNVVLEAMAAGRPVVAARAEGVVDLLGPGAEAQTFEFGNRSRLVALLTELARDPARRAELGRRNQTRVRAEFSWDAALAQYATLYAAARP